MTGARRPAQCRPIRWRLAAGLAVASLFGLSSLAGAAAPAGPEQPDVGRLPASPTCSEPGLVTRVGAWASVRTPVFTEQPLGQGQDVTSYVVSPHDQRRVFVTNGTSVLRTLDAGCTWTESYVLPTVKTDEQPLSVGGTRLSGLVVPEDPRAANRVLLIAQEVGGAPHLLVSQDGSEDSFELRDTGLPAEGEASDLVVSPSNPEFVFVSLRFAPQPAGPTPTFPGLPPLPTVPGAPPLQQPDTRTAPRGGLYASVDGGAAFELRLDPTDPAVASSAVDDLITDPLAANQLWAVSAGVLRHSDDAGRSFRAAVPSPQEQADRGWQVTAVVIDAGPDRIRRVLAFTSTSAQRDGPRLLTSVDGGVSFDETSAPGPVDSAVLVGIERRTLAVSTTGTAAKVLVLSAGQTRSVDITPVDSGRPFSLSTDRTSRATLHARTPRTLLRYVGPLVTPPPTVPPAIGAVVDDGDLPPLGIGVFTPARDDLTLQVGQTTTVPHRLAVPRRGTPLDLYVLVDTTISMRDDLPQVSRGVLALVDRLVAQGLDLRIGLGEFKGQESTIAYRRVLGVGPGLRDFRSALAGLKADGFGLEMQLIALEQALDGRGESPDALIPATCKASDRSPDRFVLDEKRTAPLVSPGQAADFQDSHVKVLMMITDTAFLRPAGTRLTPDCRVDTVGVANRYATAGVHQVGVGVDDIDNPRTAEDLLIGAGITGAIQPGAACSPELQPSPRGPQPAVCRTATGLETTLLALHADASEPIRVTVTADPRTRVPALPLVDLRRPVPLDVPVTYTCPAEPGVTTGTLRASVPERELAVLPYRLVCQPAPPTAPPGPPTAVTQAVVVSAPVLALLPPPAIPPPPPPPAQGLQTQTQAQTQLQSGTQQERQAQAQLALALQADQQQEGDLVLGMSAREVPDVVRLTSLALLTAVGGAVAMRRRTVLVRQRHTGR